MNKADQIKRLEQERTYAERIRKDSYDCYRKTQDCVSIWVDRLNRELKELQNG